MVFRKNLKSWLIILWGFDFVSDPFHATWTNLIFDFKLHTLEASCVSGSILSSLHKQGRRRGRLHNGGSLKHRTSSSFPPSLPPVIAYCYCSLCTKHNETVRLTDLPCQRYGHTSTVIIKCFQTWNRVTFPSKQFNFLIRKCKRKSTISLHIQNTLQLLLYETYFVCWCCESVSDIQLFPNLHI